MDAITDNAGNIGKAVKIINTVKEGFLKAMDIDFDQFNTLTIVQGRVYLESVYSKELCAKLQMYKTHDTANIEIMVTGEIRFTTDISLDIDEDIVIEVMLT